MEENKPLLSIITINRNNAEGLRKTIESVRNQTSQNYEHIIIDGDSTDSSIEIINKALEDSLYKSHVAYWHSEKDRSVYDAMNKGIPHASGKYILFLNSGDFLIENEVIAKIEKLCSENEADIFYGKCLCFTKDKEWLEDHPKKLTLGYLYRKSINHQNCLIKTELQKKYPYSMDYRILSDREFFIRIFQKEETLKTTHIDFIISKYECESGLSSANPEKVKIEEKRLRETAFPKIMSEAFDYLENREAEVQEKLDFYEKSYHGILRKMKTILQKYTKLKSKFKKK